MLLESAGSAAEIGDHHHKTERMLERGRAALGLAIVVDVKAQLVIEADGVQLPVLQLSHSNCHAVLAARLVFALQLGRHAGVDDEVLAVDRDFEAFWGRAGFVRGGGRRQRSRPRRRRS